VTRVWLVLPDPFSSRLFFDCGIVALLRERLGERLELVLLQHESAAATWATKADGTRVTLRDELFPLRVPLGERVFRRADRWLDAKMGFYPLSLRHSIRFGFNKERMQPGHSNWFLDPQRAGPLPHWRFLDPVLMSWHYGRLRYVPAPLLKRLRRERPAIVLANMQMQVTVPFVVAGLRLGLPLVGYIASWDHTVGKGIVSPHMRRYLVQNRTMRDDLTRYHAIDPTRIVVTGWPQTDVFSRRRPRGEYEAVLRQLGLDPSRPIVLVMGNTPTNAPYEERFVQRLVSWWDSNGARGRFSLLFRPHPRDQDWRRRFDAALGLPDAAVQRPSFTDIDTLAVLLQHGDCVVANAGTILLDSVVNDRPAVCVVYDEGAPSGESWALKNVTGEHYGELMASDAFYRAERFEDVVVGIDRALALPGELAPERARVAREVVGEVDGGAALRVVEATLHAITADQA
jgi:hypothetical protein